MATKLLRPCFHFPLTRLQGAAHGRFHASKFNLSRRRSYVTTCAADEVLRRCCFLLWKRRVVLKCLDSNVKFSVILQSVHERRGRCTCGRRHSASARGVSFCHPVLHSISTNESQRHHQNSFTAVHMYWEEYANLSQLSGHQSPQQLTRPMLGSRTQSLIELCCACPMQVLSAPDVDCRHMGTLHCTHVHMFLQGLQPS